jgi:hypothetical protein
MNINNPFIFSVSERSQMFPDREVAVLGIYTKYSKISGRRSQV